MTGTSSNSGAPPPLPPAAPPADDRHPVLRVWRNPNYLLFEAGWTPQSITTWIQRVGVLWLAWELTHSNAWVGAVAAADLAPMIVLAPLAGAMADRARDALRLLRLTKWLMLLQAIALAALMYAGLMTIELLLLLSVVTGVIHPYSSAARQIVVASSVVREDFPPAIALDSALFQASRFVGPALAAVMISMWGVGSTFLAHVVGSTILLGMLMMMRIPPRERSSKLRRGLLIEIADSVRYTRGHGAIWPLFLMLAVTSIMVRPIQELLPGFASNVFNAGPEGLGWLASSMGVGATASATWIALRGRIEGLSTWAITGGLILIVSTLAFASTDRMWLGLVLIGIAAFGINTMSTSIQTITQSVVSDAMRGRVMSLYSLIFRGLPAIGAFGLGALADRIGLQSTFTLVSIMSLAVWALVAIRWREIAAAVTREVRT
jgi:predicted MFS family arabinose efflux permease